MQMVGNLARCIAPRASVYHHAAFLDEKNIVPHTERMDLLFCSALSIVAILRSAPLVLGSLARIVSSAVPNFPTSAKVGSVLLVLLVACPAHMLSLDFLDM